ncbi:hypothetical protein UPYG_G00273010 [Umbra pygmaea]|uniref:Uncharacterized protein n=1 Tax=Umbra pygmaea TaxID=75934 RepID=A0ABD0WYU7_UMBPY
MLTVKEEKKLPPRARCSSGGRHFWKERRGEEERIEERAVTREEDLKCIITPTRRSVASHEAPLPDRPSVPGQHLDNVFNVIGRPLLDVPVETIKEHILSGVMPGDIAQIFGVSQATIQRRCQIYILTSLTWNWTKWSKKSRLPNPTPVTVPHTVTCAREVFDYKVLESGSPLGELIRRVSKIEK